MKKLKIAAGLLACCMAWTPIQAFAVNLHDEATMTDREKELKEYADIVINLVNNERVFYRGLEEVSTFPALNEITCVRAEETSQAYGHVRPNGSLCFSALKEDAKIAYNAAYENIAAGQPNPATAVQCWMDSEGHRKNILRENLTHVGVGYFYLPQDPNGYQFYWSQFLIVNRDAGVPHIFEEEGQYIPERWYGDPDGSHEINAADAKMILYYEARRSAGIDIKTPTGFETAADVNQDGVVNAVDASIILEYVAALGSGTSRELSDYVW